METREEFKNKMKEVVCVIPKLSEAIMELRNELSEGNDIKNGKSGNRRSELICCDG